MSAPTPSAHQAISRSKTEACTTRRYKVFLRSDIVTGDVRIRAHTLYISAQGALLHVHAPLHARSFHIILDNQQYRAEVMWIDGKKLDVRFTPPLTVATVEQLIPLVSEMIR